MAKNALIPATKTRSRACTDPAIPVSGDPVIITTVPGVALTNEGAGGNVATETTVGQNGVYPFSVKGIDGGGNSAVADGDAIYYVAADTPKLSKKATGVPFGKAFAVPGSGGGTLITSGATTTIYVEIGA